MLKIKIALFGIVVAIGIAVIGYNYWTKTPEYSLNQIQTAIETNDVHLFNKHVDVDTAVSRAVDTIIESSFIRKEREDDNNSMEKLASGMIAMMKPKIVDYIKTKVIMAVEGEAPNVSNNQNISDNQSLNELENFFSGENKASVSYLKKESNIAYLGLDKFNEKLQENITLELKLRRMDDYWQIVEASNLREMLDVMETLKAKRLAELNAPIVETLNEAIAFKGFSKQNNSESVWNKKIMIGLKLDNNLKETLTAVSIELELLNEQNEVINTYQLAMDELAVVKNADFYWEFDINPFIKRESAVFDLPDGYINHKVSTVSFQLASGESVTKLNDL